MNFYTNVWAGMKPHIGCAAGRALRLGWARTRLRSGPAEQVDGFDAERICEYEDAVQARAVPAVFNPVDCFAIKSARFGQALLSPVGSLTQGGDAVSELGTVSRQTRIHR
jgi:hypothetical protein